MEGWRGYNYLTTNESLWIRYINSSTLDWNIGAFPSNIVAISGSLNDSYKFPNDTLVIENVGRTHLGKSAIEVAVYGIAASLVILYAVIWLVFNRRSFLEPPAGDTTSTYDPVAPTDAETGSGSNTATRTTNGAKPLGLTVAEFRDLLNRRYYESVMTEAELYEKDENDNFTRLEPADIETITALMREVYRLDLLLWAKQNARNRREDDQGQLKDRSDAAWAEVRNKIERWSDRHRGHLTPEEAEYLDESLAIVRRIPAKRYGERPGR